MDGSSSNYNYLFFLNMRPTDQKFQEVKIETTIEDGDADFHPVTLVYARWIGTNVITDWKITFINERKFTGWEYLTEIVREIIEGLEGTRDLDFTSQIVIE